MNKLTCWLVGFKAGYIAGQADEKFQAMFFRGLADRDRRIGKQRQARTDFSSKPATN